MMIAGTAFAQSNTGEIAGTVHDPQGAVVPGAAITITGTETGLVRAATTSDNGAFRFVALPAGIYALSAEKSGFAVAKVARIEVLVAEIATVDVALALASSTQTVAVESSVTMTDTETAHLGSVIKESQVTTLPLNGRDFAQLALLNAGVSASGGGGGQQGGEGGVSGYSSNGQRSTSNNFMVDGVDNNNYEAGSVAQLPSIDSIQEFQVQTNNYSAEYGRSSGSIVNLVTKSGTNQLHGSAYEFFRNNVLDARNFFADPAFAAPALRLNQFGATLGGPIQKDKTFFFGNYEGFRQVAGITNLTNVPTDTDRSGLFLNPATGLMQQVAVNPTSAQLFKLFPEPDTTQSGGNFVSSPTLTNSTNQYMIKADRHLAHGMLTARYSFTGATIFYPFQPGQGVTAIPGYGVNDKETSHLASLGHTWFISPSNLNEFRFGFTRVTGFTSNQPGPQAATYNFNTGWPAGSPTGLGDIPNITFSGGLVSGVESTSNLGATGNNPAGNWINTLQFVDNFSHITPRHEWKFGGEIRNIRDNRVYDLFFNGQLGFTGSANPEGIPNPLVDFAEGLPSSSLQFVGNSGRSYRTTSYDIFAQDKFKLRRNLTLTYGLRYELNTVLHDATNRSSTWRPNLFSHIPPAQRGSNQSSAAPGIGDRHAETARRSLRRRSQQLCAAHWPGLVARRVASDRPSRRIWDFLRHGFREHSWKRDVESAVLARLLHPFSCVPAVVWAVRLPSDHHHSGQSSNAVFASVEPGCSTRIAGTDLARRRVCRDDRDALAALPPNRSGVHHAGASQCAHQSGHCHAHEYSRDSTAGAGVPLGEHRVYAEHHPRAVFRFRTDLRSGRFDELELQRAAGKSRQTTVPRPDLWSRLHLFEVDRRRLRLFRLRRKRQHHLSAE